MSSHGNSFHYALPELFGATWIMFYLYNNFSNRYLAIPQTEPPTLLLPVTKEGKGKEKGSLEGQGSKSPVNSGRWKGQWC